MKALSNQLREMREELSIDESLVEVVHDNMWTDHEDWHYHTVIALTSRDVEFITNEEAELADWIEISKIQDLDLHPGFASNWQEILIAIEGVLARN